MRLVARKEWDSTPVEFKRVFDSTPYMFYKDSDGSACFGPVKIIEDSNSISDKKNSVDNSHVDHIFH